MIVDRAGDEIEGDGGAGDLGVVDLTGRFGIFGAGEAEVHTGHRTGALGRELGIPCGAWQDNASFVGLARRAPLAQSAERFHGKEKVDSSILSGGSVPEGLSPDRPPCRRSSAGQSTRLIIEWSSVQVRPPTPIGTSVPTRCKMQEIRTNRTTKFALPKSDVQIQHVLIQAMATKGTRRNHGTREV